MRVTITLILINQTISTNRAYHANRTFGCGVKNAFALWVDPYFLYFFEHVFGIQLKQSLSTYVLDTQTDMQITVGDRVLFFNLSTKSVDTFAFRFPVRFNCWALFVLSIGDQPTLRLTTSCHRKKFARIWKRMIRESTRHVAVAEPRNQTKFGCNCKCTQLNRRQIKQMAKPLP